MPFTAEYSNVLTIKRILAAISDQPNVLRYLPDNPAAHVSRQYLITIVNTLDP
jgi:hypothetical protein